MSGLNDKTSSGTPVYGFSRIVHGNMAFVRESSRKQVLKAREVFLSTLFPSPPPPLFTLKQVHGNNVVLYEEGKVYSNVPVGDALITRSKNIAIGVLTADCLPILLYDRTATGVGVIHAGRIGSLKRVTGKAVRRFLTDFSINPSNTFVVIGPGILSCCYEVREDAIKPFEKYYRISEIASKCSCNLWKLDLVSVNVGQVLACGVPFENISLSGICTMCAPDFFSFRKDSTKKRFLSVISLEGRPGI